MNREELLTREAMQLPYWPGCISDYWKGFTYKEWAERRAELINKPSWDDVPKWSNWLAQDEDGEWRVFRARPKYLGSGDHWFIEGETIKDSKVTKGECPMGHNWRNTLEKRPGCGSLEGVTTSLGAAPQRSDGSTAKYYELPIGAIELQDLISYRNMNAQIGEIFRAAYRYGQASHSDKLRDAKKIRFYAEAEIERLERYGNDR